MKIIKPTIEQREYVKSILDKGMGKRGIFDGGYYERLFGLIGQVIICDMFNYPRPTDLTKADAGFDIEIGGKKYDIKCEIRTVDFKRTYVHNVAATQINYKTDGYIFMSFNKEIGEYTICGYISKEELKTKADYIKLGTHRRRTNGTYMPAKCDYYELKNKFLLEINNDARM